MADLQLPDHRELLAQPVLVEGLQVDDVVELRGCLVGRAARQTLRRTLATAQVEPRTSTT